MQAHPRTFQVTPALAQVAQANHLGRVLYDHQSTDHHSWFGLSLGILLLGGVFLAFGHDTSTGIVMESLIVACGIAVLIGGWFVKRRDIHVYLCDQGLIYTGARIHPQPFRWDQMQVWRAVTRYSRNGIHTHTTYRYTIQRQDGYRIILQYFVGIKTLGETISNQVTQAVLPQATQAYNAGQTVQFGSLSLNRQGVSNGWNVLPWSQVEAIDVTNGVVSVKRQGGWFRWSKVAASAIPNLFVFLALTNAILKSAGKR